MTENSNEITNETVTGLRGRFTIIESIDNAINEFYERTKRDPKAVEVPVSLYKILKTLVPVCGQVFDIEFQDSQLSYLGIPVTTHGHDTITVS